VRCGQRTFRPDNKEDRHICYLCAEYSNANQALALIFFSFTFPCLVMPLYRYPAKMGICAPINVSGEAWSNSLNTPNSGPVLVLEMP